MPNAIMFIDKNPNSSTILEFAKICGYLIISRLIFTNHTYLVRISKINKLIVLQTDIYTTFVQHLRCVLKIAHWSLQMSPHMSRWPKRPLYILESPFHTCLCTRYLHCTYIVCSYLCMCDLHLDCYDRLDKNSFTIFPSQALEFVISSVIIMVGFFPNFSHSGLTIGKSFRVLSVF